MTTSSTAEVVTDRPARFGKQLVSHLGRRSGGEWDDKADTGWIQMGLGRAELTCDPGVLHLRVEGEKADLPQLEDVVGRHLVHFGAKDELVVHWTHADGSAGTQQTSD
jgi:hypothetical protein